MESNIQNIKTSDVVRAFIALEISDTVRNVLAATQKDFRRAQARVSWVAPQNIHLSLAFLGDIFGTTVHKLADSLDEIVKTIPVFTLDVHGIGTFGRHGKPRVVWAGVPCIPRELTNLHEQVALAVLDAGVALDERPFRPHLTLGRIRASGNVDALTSAIASAKNKHYGSVDIYRVLLMRSRLLPQGAQYSVLHQAHLKGEK